MANLRLPCWFNGLGRGCLTGGHPLSFLRTRSMVKAEADVVVVIGAPLDFRLSFGNFGSAKVIHVVDSESSASHVEAVITIVGDLRTVLNVWGDHAAASVGERSDHEPWIERLRVAEDDAISIDDTALGSAAFPDRLPSRIYGELRHRPRAERRRHLRRRGLRFVCRKVRGGAAARVLARHGTIRLLGELAWICHRGADRSPGQPDRAVAR